MLHVSAMGSQPFDQSQIQEHAHPACRYNGKVLGGHVMWKVAVVQPVTEGFGFNITTETNVQLVSFAYATRAEAEAAATHAQAAVEKAVSVLPLFNPQPRRRWWTVLLDLWNR
jgi:hypothetical protein